MKLSKALLLTSIAASTYDKIHIWVHNGSGEWYNYCVYEIDMVVDVSTLENTNIIQSLLKEMNTINNNYTVDTNVVSLELKEAKHHDKCLFVDIVVDRSEHDENASEDKQS